VAAGLLLVYELGMRLPLIDGWGGGSFALDDNFVRWLDLQLWGAAHLYGGAGVAFDPEGLWSSLPAAVTTLLGYFAGLYLLGAESLTRKLRGFAAAGLALFLAGQLLHMVEPVNKQLWTVSYVVLTGGLALLTLAFSLWAIDMRGWRRGTLPAVVFGSNPLVAFVGSGLLARLLVMVRAPGSAGGSGTLKHWLHGHLFASWASPQVASALFAVGQVLLWLGLLWVLYRRKVFIKI
jgi:predicted acyltransferase